MQRLLPLLLVALAGCGRVATSPPPVALAPAESLYAELRWLRDRYEVTAAAGRTHTPEGTPLDSVARRHNELRLGVWSRLAAVDESTVAGEQHRALVAMRAGFVRDLGPLPVAPATAEAGEPAEPDCTYD
ncbi:MAG TPA: hypothetical protein VFU46_14360, partial [Gemmatimonadales bacterium]|nr:hypothetical protein [Gemmatimonadales bacterium]